MRRLAALAILACLGCNDRTTPPLLYDPGDDPEPDAASPDTGEGVEPMLPDELCRGRDDGTRCELENGTGTCAREQCRFLACFTGWADCDDSLGCETDTATDETCGGCDIACDGRDTCARSGEGWVCARGVTCPGDRFDLDGDPSNGCETVADWTTSAALVPPDLRIDVANASADSQVLLAGIAEDGGRVSTSLAPTPRRWELPPDVDAVAVAVEQDSEGVRVLWSDGLSYTVDGDEQFAALDCATSRRYVALDGDVVASRDELASVVSGELVPLWGHAEYLAAFQDEFESDEVAQCDLCHLDEDGNLRVPVACIGDSICRDDGFDIEPCQGCGPLGSECPQLRIVGYAAAGEYRFVATARGLVVLDRDFAKVARAENPHDPTSAGGARFVGFDVVQRGTQYLVSLYHSEGFVRGLTLEGGVLRPRHPDIGTGLNLEAHPPAVAGSTFVAHDGREVRLIGLSERSGRAAWLGYETAPGIQGLRPVATTRRAGMLVVLYLASGRIYLREITSD